VSTFFDYMGVYHCGVEVFVAEEFLDGADVVAGGEEFGGEAMAKCVTAGGF